MRWQNQAACLDADWPTFHPRKETDDAYAVARTICATCPVKAECLIDAMAYYTQSGMRAGLTPDERKKVGSR